MPHQNQSRQGVIFALLAYVMWGIAPIYFKMLTAVSAGEILSHRIVWSCLLLLALLTFSRQWRKVQSVFANPKQLLVLTTTALLIGMNWLIFIWSVNHNRMLDASLGYFINPLVNIVLGMLFLGERFRRMQWMAVGLALAGVLIELIHLGSLPWISLSLATSFGLYGLLRKKVNLAAITGLFVETLLLMPVAFIYLMVWGEGDMSLNPVNLNLLLVSAGLVTTVPLLCFAGAATRLKLSTLGFFQYIGPSMMFILATVLYNEPLEPGKFMTFALIWTALALFSLDGLRHRTRRQTNVAS
jgi:chloramphenicol-sensitive protein RarD